jgi:hypothetical protein
MALIIVLRDLSITLLEVTFLSKVNLPLEAVIYLLFAMQENYCKKK